jgi:fimbrial chaperone protein
MRARHLRLLSLACAALGLSGIPHGADAGSLRIMPIRVEAAPDARFCNLTIANDEDLPVSVQVRGYGWSKDASGTDVLTEDTAFQVNPTILTLAAKEQRLVRCGLPPLPGNGEQSEQTWRLLIDELPRPGPSLGGIRTLLRISLPVFRAPANAQPDLVWSIREAATGGAAQPELVIENRGSRHAQVLALEVISAQAGHTIAGSFYILAGGRAVVALPGGFAGAPSAVRANTPDGPLDLRSGAGS